MMGTAVGTMFVAGAEVVRKSLKAPESRMAHRLIVSASVVIIFRSNKLRGHSCRWGSNKED